MRDGKRPPPLFLMSARATLGGADSAGGACRSAFHPRAAPPTLLPGDAQPSALLANRTKTTIWVRKRAGTRKAGMRSHGSVVINALVGGPTKT